MLTIARGDFQGTNAELLAQVQQRVAAFKQALADHAKTKGVPAPRDDDLIERLARTDEPYEIEPEPSGPAPLTPVQQAELDMLAKRAAALRALDDQRLQAAIADPNAPQEVRDYVAAGGR